jgi:hypothetical protein
VLILLPLLATAILARPDFGTTGGDHHDHEHHEHHEEHHEHHEGHHDENAEEQPVAAIPAEPEKKCELVRSPSATSPECFLEPECEEVCRPNIRQKCVPYEDKVCKDKTMKS